MKKKLFKVATISALMVLLGMAGDVQGKDSGRNVLKDKDGVKSIACYDIASLSNLCFAAGYILREDECKDLRHMHSFIVAPRHPEDRMMIENFLKLCTFSCIQGHSYKLRRVSLDEFERERKKLFIKEFLDCFEDDRNKKPK